jgi:hypothetical protein
MTRVFAAVCAAALAISGCAAPPVAPAVGPDPSNPAARTPAVDYRSTTAPYSSRRPVEPGPSPEQSWREQNERAAPQPKSAQ